MGTLGDGGDRPKLIYMKHIITKGLWNSRKGPINTL